MIALPFLYQPYQHLPNKTKKERHTIFKSQHNNINMQSISIINSSQLFHQFSSTKPPFSNYKKPISFPPIMASNREAADHNFGGRLVDESMIILRKRIHEMNMIEKNYEAPSNWMEWEKKYYTSYDSIICEAMGVLQTQLMNTRPSVALGVIAFVAISVPTSSALIFLHLLELARNVFGGIHIF
ncbi:uncharacterized protein [Cicer arietinum]|uniref:Uncharacterized protein LOC101493310 n=1 Tax=Cicer arietinum TaxID=3827 RepID=A0A1S2Y0S9_CICAR|nr:uncharacterized protein LOC101493310 [Cicer arietinum]